MAKAKRKAKAEVFPMVLYVTESGNHLYMVDDNDPTVEGNNGEIFAKYQLVGKVKVKVPPATLEDC